MISQRKAGVILSYFLTFISIAVSFIYLRALFTFLDQEEYGLYQLMGALASYVSIMDFGMGATITRYYSQAISRKDEKGKENILALSVIIYAFIILITVIIGFALFFTIDKLYSATLNNTQLIEAKKIYVILVINIILSIPASIFNAVMNSHEKFIFDRCLNILHTIVQPIAIICVVIRFPSAFYIVIVQTILNIILIAVKIFYCFKILKIKIKLHKFDRSLAKELILFSFLIFVNIVIDRIYWKADQIILGAVIGMSAVAVYSIASQFCAYFMQFSTNISSVFLPKISRILADSEDMDEVNKIFVRVGRIQFFVLSLILTGFIVFGRQFILLWIGEKYYQAYFMAVFIMLPLLIPLIQNTGVVILQAKNLHWFRSVSYIFIAVFNIVLSVILAKRYGGVGCAFATGLSILLGNIIAVNIYYQKKAGIDVISFFKTILRISAPAVISLAIGLIIIYFMPPMNFLWLFVEIAGYCLFFFGLMWLMAFDKYEKDLISLYLKRIFRY